MFRSNPRRLFSFVRSRDFRLVARGKNLFPSFFFGDKSNAPGGDLPRLNVKKFPDQYPAEKFLQAEPVKGDSRDMAVIRPVLKQTELGKEPGGDRGGRGQGGGHLLSSRDLLFHHCRRATACFVYLLLVF